VDGQYVISNVTATTFEISANVTSAPDQSGTVEDTEAFLGCDWNNGEQKEVYSTSYTDTTVGSQNIESWAVNASGTLIYLKAASTPSATYYGFPNPAGYNRVSFNKGGATRLLLNQSLGSPMSTPYNTNISTDNFTGLGAINGVLNNEQFGQLTTTSGLTVVWVKNW
jgi:hypothetical protein